MTMSKRKAAHHESKTINSTVSIVMKKLECDYPMCLHGPALLFSSAQGEFFACSSCRDKKSCNLHISIEDWTSPTFQQNNKKYCEMIPKINKKNNWKTYCRMKTLKESQRAFCTQCEQLCTVSDDLHKQHKIIKPLSDLQLLKPSAWLPCKQNDKVEAQYIFTDNTIGVIIDTLRENKLRSVICIGTPSVHEAIQSKGDMDSLLLDIDARHSWFHPPWKFLWYNMFNNFFFDSINSNQDRGILLKFIENASKLCVILDPPFGGRVEPLVQTLTELTCLYNSVKGPTVDLLPVIWVFPYFSEPHIVNMLPQLAMHDFQVEYINHCKFQSGSRKSRKYGSPVRIFTNLPLSSLKLFNNGGYVLCSKCQIWVSSSNRHCDACGKCTSKNGMTYVHCDACGRCVKPTFFHCAACQRCCQRRDHECGLVVLTQACYLCGEKGHKRVNCPSLLKASRTDMENKGNRRKKKKL